MGTAHLGVAGPEELLLIAKIDLDVPAPKIILDKLLDRKIGIGADEVGRSGIAPRPVLFVLVAKRSNDHDLNDFVFSSLMPLGSFKVLVTDRG